MNKKDNLELIDEVITDEILFNNDSQENALEVPEVDEHQDKKEISSKKIFNNKDRRFYMRKSGQLKAKNKLVPFSPEWVEWYRMRKQEGEKLHAKNMEIFTKEIENQMLKKEESMIKSYKEFGYSKEEIEEMIQRWYKDNVK